MHHAAPVGQWSNFHTAEVASSILASPTDHEIGLNWQFKGCLPDDLQCTSLTVTTPLVPLRVARVWHDGPNEQPRSHVRGSIPSATSTAMVTAATTPIFPSLWRRMALHRAW